MTTRNSLLSLALVTAVLLPAHQALASVTEVQRAADLQAQDALPHRLKVGLGLPIRSVQDFRRQHASRIIENGQAPIHDSNYVFVNQFDGTAGNQIVNVYAGYYRSHPSQGILMIMKSSADLSVTQATQFINGPPGMGALHIVKILGDRLEIASARGAVMIVPIH